MSRMRLDWRMPSGIPLQIRSYGDWCIYNEVFVNGEYDEAISELLRSTSSGRLRILDLGANTGFFRCGWPMP